MGNYKLCVFVALCWLTWFTSCTSADFNTALASVTKSCSYTVDRCVALATLTLPTTDATWCQLFSITKDGVTSYQCLVRFGFCTNEELVSLKNAACNQTSAVQIKSSDLKLHVTSAIKSTSTTCQQRIVFCVMSSSVATVLKQQEQYCKLMKLGISGKVTTACLSPNCTNTEISNLRTAACLNESSQSKLLSNAIVESSQTCQDGIEFCTYTSTAAFALIRSEQYCNVMNLKETQTTYQCLKDRGCSDTEFNSIKTAACNNSITGGVSRACIYTVNLCLDLSGIQPIPTQEVWCRVLDMSKDGVTAYQCLVQLGFCTNEEYVALKNRACTQNSAPQQPSTALKMSVYQTLATTSDTCQQRVLTCVFQSSIATVFKQQEQFCKMMNMGINGQTSAACLAQGCQNTEIFSLNTTACSTPQFRSLSDALFAASQKCQVAIETCTYSTYYAFALIRSEQYCSVMHYEDITTAYVCLTQAGCTDGEFQTLKTSACTGSKFATTSKACMYTIDSCIQLSGVQSIDSDQEWCAMFDMSRDGVTAYQCLVKFGLCTDEEFVDLKNGACDQTSPAQLMSSELKKSVYNSINSTNDTCVQRVISCIFGSSIATILKQQEQYCKLMNLGVRATTTTVCLSQGCSSTEISAMNTTACSTNQSRPLSNAIVSTSQTCQLGIEICAYSAYMPFALIRSEQYCNLMHFKEQMTTQQCLIGKGCTEKEFKQLESAACIGSYISKTCLYTVEACLDLVGLESVSTDTEWCSLLDMNKDGVSAYQCLVRFGFCTGEEFIQLRNEKCRQKYAPLIVSTELKKSVYKTVTSTSDNCQRQIITCIFRSSVATVLKQQEQYCKLLNLGAGGSTTFECLSNMCTKPEIAQLNNSACATPQSMPFSNTIFSSSNMCQNAMEICTYSTYFAFALIRSEKYCEVINYSDQVPAYVCLIKNGCSFAEMASLNSSACAGSQVAAISTPCSYTIRECIALSGVQLENTNIGWCKLLTMSKDDVTAYQCLVKFGLCTDEEFTAMKNEACGPEVSDKLTSSPMKTSVYNAISLSNDSCQQRILTCIFYSPVATVLKQQEQYCKLLNLGPGGATTRTCLQNACTNDEIDRIKNASCISEQPATFSNAIVSSTLTCQVAMEQCTYSTYYPFALIRSEKYCDVMNFKDQITAYACLTAGGCSDTEYKTLKTAACCGTRIFATLLILTLTLAQVFV